MEVRLSHTELAGMEVGGPATSHMLDGLCEQHKHQQAVVEAVLELKVGVSSCM